MPSALALPDEIICEILTLVGSNKPSLCSLARASRRFSILASQCIFRDVNLGVQLRNPSWPKTFHLFFRSLEENPSLASQVHALDLGWNDPRTGRTNFDICLRANDLLAKLTNLQSLAIEANGPRDYLWKPTFLETIPMSSLRSITLSHDSTTIADVITLMQIESLEHLDVQELDLGAPAPATVALGRKASLLSTLYFGGVFSVPENILWTLLQLAPSLKELRCSIPGPKAHPGLRQYAAFPTNMGSIANALEPVQHCLVRLVLFQGKLTNWALYGDSCLDLSQFRSLKIVEAPIPCFFRARGPDASRNSVYALLPSTLEELDVHFPQAWHFIYDVQTEWYEFAGNSYDVEASKYSWVEEIAAHIPNFKRLVITEQTHSSRHHYYSGFLWSRLPTRLKTVLDAAGVSTDILLRRPLEVEREEHRNQGEWSIGN